MFVQKFDIYKFETKVRQLITEAINPVTVDQVDIFRRQDDIKNEQNQLRNRITDSSDELRRANELIKELKRFDADFSAVKRNFEGFKEVSTTNTDTMDRSISSMKTEIKMLRLELEKCQSDCVTALATKGIDMPKLA